MTENSGPKQAGRFEKGRSGNPAGKPHGARHRATLAAEMLLDGEAQALTRKAIERALEGDSTALRLCLERIVPVRKERPLRLALPSLTNAGDAARAIAAITAAVMTLVACSWTVTVSIFRVQTNKESGVLDAPR